jgi:hypothetical protein
LRIFRHRFSAKSTIFLADYYLFYEKTKKSMDKKARSLDKKLEQSREREDPELAARRHQERKRMYQMRKDKEKQERVIKLGLKEFHARPIERLKSTDEAFESAHYTVEEDLRQQTYGLVTLDEFRKRREQIEKEMAEKDQVLAEKRKRDEEEAKARKEEEKAKRIKQQQQTLSFVLDDE